MSSTIDLVKAAQNREYINFEDKALSMLKTKVQENPIMQAKLAELNVAQGITEGEDKDLKAEYDAYFAKKLKAAGVDSPDDLDDEAKKKFFDDVESGWSEGEGEK